MSFNNLESHNKKKRDEFHVKSAKGDIAPIKNGFECPNIKCRKELMDKKPTPVEKKEMLAKKEAGALVKQKTVCSCGWTGFRYL